MPATLPADQVVTLEGFDSAYTDGNGGRVICCRGPESHPDFRLMNGEVLVSCLHAGLRAVHPAKLHALTVSDIRTYYSKSPLSVQLAAVKQCVPRL